MASHGEGYRKPEQGEPVSEIHGPFVVEEVSPEEEWRNRAESAKDTFESIFKKVANLKAQNDPDVLQQYLIAMHEEYFASSNDLFSELSLKDNFEMLMRINKIDEMQGPIGQAGVNQLVLRLSYFRDGEGSTGNEEIFEFVGGLLKGKNISDTVAALAQLQTVAAQGLANSSWAGQVYEGIQKYLKTPVPHEVFILSKVKERLSQRLSGEEERPTMGVITTLNNSHQALMYEGEVFDAELDAKVNETFSFGSALKVRIATLSRDYSGIFDTRNRLVSLVPAKALESPQTKAPEQASTLPSMNDFYDTARFLNGRNHLFNKALYVFSKSILEPSQESSLTAQFAELLSIPVEELSEYVENEKQYNTLEMEKREVSAEIEKKSNQLFALMKRDGFDFEKFGEFERSLYEAFGKQYVERKNKRQPVETLDLTQAEGLGFLGLTEDNVELFKILQYPYFTRAIQEVVGIKLSDLDMRAQTAFLNYLARATKSDVEGFSLLLNKFDSEDRVKICSAYLAFEDEAYFSYIIESLCRRPEVALPIMSVVYGLIGNAGKIEDFLLSEFHTGGERTVIASVYQKLIGKAKDILLQYNAKSMGIDDIAEIAYGTEMLGDHTDVLEEYGHSIDRNDTHMKNPKEAERELVEEARQEAAKTNVNQILFLNSFKSLKEAGVAFSLEDIKNSSFRETIGSEVPPEQITQMRKIYESNQSANPAVQKELLDKFEQMLVDEKTRFYVFSYDQEVTSFVAFTPTSMGHVRASAFNVIDKAQGYRIGEAMIHKTIDTEAQTYILDGDCDTRKPLVARHVENGWIATRYWNDEGDPVLDVLRDDSKRDSYWGKSQSRDALIIGNAPEGVKIGSAKSQDKLPFELCNEGYVLTRMFLDPKTKLHYGVFESAVRDDRA